MPTLTVADVLLDSTIRHAHIIERFKLGEARKISKLMQNQVMPDLLKQVESKLGPLKGRGLAAIASGRYKDAIAGAASVTNAAMARVGEQLTGDLKQFAVAEATMAGAQLQAAVPLDWNWTTPSPELVRAAVTSAPFQGALLKEHFDKLSFGTQTALRRSINIGIVEGESIGQIVSRLRHDVKIAKRQAETLVRTSIKHVSSQARETYYQANDDIIKGVIWVSTLDARTTLICADLDGQTFELAEGPRPPVHMQCRSDTVPWVKSLKELGFDVKEQSPFMRASMNGEVPAKLNYGDWLKKQPVNVQNEALGLKRAKLFRNGMPISKFLGPGRRPLSLVEIEGRAQDFSVKLSAMKPATRAKKINGYYEELRAGVDKPRRKIINIRLKNLGVKEIAAGEVVPANVTVENLTGAKLPLPLAATPASLVAPPVGTSASPILSEFAELSTQQVAKALQTEGLAVDFGRVHKTHARRIATEMRAWTAEHGSQVTNALRKVVAVADLGDATMAIRIEADGTMILRLNERMLRSPTKITNLLKREFKRGWLAGDDLRHIVNHELGHAIERGRYFNALESRAVLQKWMKSGFSSELSQYATESIEEAWAEAYAKVMTTPANKLNALQEQFRQALIKDLQTHSYPIPKRLDVTLTAAPNFKRAATTSDWIRSLNDAERRALHSWTSQGYQKVQNAQLGRGGDHELLKQINAAFNKAPVSTPQRMFRGMRLTDEEFARYRPGAKITLKTHQSYSTSPVVARGFTAKSLEGRPVLIEVRNGSGIDVQSISMFQKEREVIALKDTVFNVIEVKTVPGLGGAFRIIVKQVQTVEFSAKSSLEALKIERIKLYAKLKSGPSPVVKKKVVARIKEIREELKGGTPNFKRAARSPELQRLIDETEAVRLKIRTASERESEKLIDRFETLKLKLEKQLSFKPGQRAKTTGEWSKQLTDAEKMALRGWSEGTYVDIRKLMITGKGTAETKKSLSLLEHAFEIAPAPKPKRLYRGLSLKPKEWAQFKKGKIIQNDSYASFSKRKSVGEGFATESEETGRVSVLLEVENGKGVDIQRWSEFGAAEVIVLSGTRWQVLSITEKYFAIDEVTVQIVKMKEL